MVAVQLYKSLEYEQALEQLQRAKRLAHGIEQDSSVALHEGIILADMGKREESLIAFKTALLLNPGAKLPFTVSPKMAHDVEEIRARKEAAPLYTLVSQSIRRSPIERTTLLERLTGYEAQLHQRSNLASNGPAMAQLQEVRQQLERATTVGQHMDVFVRLDEWERQFLSSQEASADVALVARPPSGLVQLGPGSSPKQLKTADIMTVVTAHKPAIVECVKKQREQKPALSGKLVMRWSIQPDGSAKDVSCVSGAMCSTHFAGCLTGLIPGWTFPARAMQAEAVDFSFVF
jgi:hypothetical protein